MTQFSGNELGNDSSPVHRNVISIVRNHNGIRKLNELESEVGNEKVSTQEFNHQTKI